MAEAMYSITALVFVLVLGLILINERRINRHPKSLEKQFRLMLSWVIFFCIQDVVWGLCDAGIIKGDEIFFASSTVFHLSTVITTFFWLNYILHFVGEDRKHRNLYLTLDLLVIIFEVVLVIRNFFTPTLFTIQNGEYVVEKFRKLTFVNQYIVYLLIAFASLLWAFQAKKGESKKYWSVFFFAVFPVLTGVFQLLFPLEPFYSIGYFLGCFTVYLFIVTREREDAQLSNIIKSVSEMYYSLHQIDIESGSIDAFIQSDMVSEVIEGAKDAQDAINKAFAGTACEDHVKPMLDFVNLSTLKKRMQGKKSISIEFLGKYHGWMRAYFIALSNDPEMANQVMFLTQVIDEEKKSRIELNELANNDSLTGIFNRRAFDTDMAVLDVNGTADNFVYISADVNGLKPTNDNLGHDAGDELLRGAAECLEKTLGKYGRVYRTGGDEFNALLYMTEEQLNSVKAELTDCINNWKGQKAKSLSISLGFVSKAETGKATHREIAIMADKRMYEAKSNYYKQNGLDRRRSN